MNKFWSVLLPILGACSVVTAAEPTSPYTESGVSIGRVFMSSAERRMLDRLRKQRPTSDRALTAPSITTHVVPEKKKAEPVGYIVRSSGAAYQWVDGDFKKTDRKTFDAGKLPGSTSVVRRTSKTAEEESGRPESDDFATAPSSEAGIDSTTGNDDRDP